MSIGSHPLNRCLPGGESGRWLGARAARARHAGPAGSETRRGCDTREGQGHDKALPEGSSRRPRCPGWPSPVKWFRRYFPRPAGNLLHDDPPPRRYEEATFRIVPSLVREQATRPGRSSAFLAVKRRARGLMRAPVFMAAWNQGYASPARFRPATQVRISHAKLSYDAISAALARQEPDRETWRARSPRGSMAGPPPR